MSLAEVGVYIQLLAAAWDSEDQGTLPIDKRQLSKITGIDSRIVGRFLCKYPGTFREVAGELRNSKLCEQAAKYREISEKRASAAQSRYPAIAEQMHRPAVASASALAFEAATAQEKDLRRSPNAPCGNHEKKRTATPQQSRYALICLLTAAANRILDQDPNCTDGELAEKLKQLAANKNLPYFDAVPGSATPIQQAITNARASRKVTEQNRHCGVGPT
jgi:uncharacterized protein YdaU (DUF1376 family)